MEARAVGKTGLESSAAVKCCPCWKYFFPYRIESTVVIVEGTPHCIQELEVLDLFSAEVERPVPWLQYKPKGLRKLLITICPVKALFMVNTCT